MTTTADATSKARRRGEGWTMSTHTTPVRRPSPRPVPGGKGSSSTSGGSRSPLYLRSHPSTLSFASLAPSDSRSNIKGALSPTSDTASEATTRRPTFSPVSSRRTGKARSERSVATTKSFAKPPASIPTGTRLEDVDLLNVDNPDALFQRFTVREVRELERKAQASAAKKQEELRQMVGERYRDLLGAADSIVRMRTGSTALLQKLEKTAHECRKEQMRKVGEDARQASMSTSIATSSGTPYTLATLVKLLLDLPTHIWRALETVDFLLAARLESLGRIVYRELQSGRWDETGKTTEGQILATFPVVERHWEALGQLGPQIVRRAKAMLKRGDGDAQKVTETLASVMLLDNISVPEALDLFLEARKSNRDGILFEVMVAGQDQKDHNGVKARAELVSSAVEIFVNTLDQLGEIFGEPGSAPLPKGLLSLLDAIQHPPNSTTTPVSPSLAARKRRSTLVNGYFKPPTQDSTPTWELPPVLSQLPNPHQIFRYLPASIVSFSPFLDTSEARNSVTAPGGLRGVVDRWFDDGRSRLLAVLGPLLQDVASVEQLSALRTTLREVLAPTGSAADTFRLQLADRVNADLEGRFLALHQAKLASLHTSTLTELASVLETLEVPPASPSDFLFSGVLPSLQTPTGLTTSSAHTMDRAFGSFVAHLSVRVEGRFPPAERVVRTMEEEARKMKEDVLSWTAGQGLERFVDQSAQVCRLLVQALDDRISASEPIALAAAQQGIVGNVALVAAASRTFTTDVFLGTKDPKLAASLRSGLQGVAAKSLSRWREDLVAEAVNLFGKGREHGVGEAVEETTLWKESEAGPVPVQPSASASASLKHVSESLGALSLNRLHFDTAIGSGIVLAVATQALKSTKAASAHGARQLIWDLQLLKELVKANEQWSQELEKSWQAEATRLGEIYALPPAFVEAAWLSALAYIRRTQNVLAPLLVPASRRSGEVLMPLGASDSVEYRSAAVTVKAGPRFVLLPVANLR